MTVVAVVALGALVVAASLSALRVVRCELLADKAIALDVITATIVCGIAVGAAWSGDGLLVDIALVLGLLGFLATVSIARFVARRGR
ncbi:MAG TPA: monovalent cation/H+ antiporter complex subunit F [Iamia sp.]|nr:monovalent cation/H+ antiporter complex subunit F [Iamia sp.]